MELQLRGGQGQWKGTAWWPWAVSWVALSGPLIPPSRSPCFIHHKSYFNWKGEEMICLLVRAFGARSEDPTPGF